MWFQKSKKGEHEKLQELFKDAFINNDMPEMERINEKMKAFELKAGVIIDFDVIERITFNKMTKNNPACYPKWVF
jgi:hypothetical protein